jgi:hypothetical protein
MTNPKTPETKGEGAEFEEIMRRLESGERVELLSLAPATPEALRTYGTLNLAVRSEGGVTRVRSGGFEVQVLGVNVVVKRGEEGIRTYTSGCLAKNFEALLFRLLSEYGYRLRQNRWVSVRLPRSDRRVRQLQSWLLAVINGFNVPLHDNPLVC